MSEAGTYGCGHPRTDENTRICGGRALCRICRNRYQQTYNRKAKAEETHAERYARHRVEYLPKQLSATRHKLAMLENEARRLGLTELLENTQ